MPKLGVNIDHVATLRQARREHDPDPIKAAKICLNSGADSIVCHLREDRRHINDHDVSRLKKTVKKLNLEMSLNAGIVRAAESIRPDVATLVPEKREEITTEGGLNVAGQFNRVKRVVARLQKKGIKVSLFVDPVKNQIQKCKEAGAQAIEIHTGAFDNAKSKLQREKEFNKIKQMAKFAKNLGLYVAVGHGLKYHNTRRIAKIKDVQELNIGHSIIAESVFTGLSKAVRRMKKLVK